MDEERVGCKAVPDSAAGTAALTLDAHDPLLPDERDEDATYSVHAGCGSAASGFARRRSV
jgi:hypothetical protein